jgi:hypothetical protein
MGSVVATCSGQRHYEDEDSSDGEDGPAVKDRRADNSLKIWSMPFLHPGSELDRDLDDRQYPELESSHQDESHEATSL